jgi:hypothetical protein
MTTPDYSDVILFDDGGIRRTFRNPSRFAVDTDGRRFAEIRFRFWVDDSGRRQRCRM